MSVILFVPFLLKGRSGWGGHCQRKVEEKDRTQNPKLGCLTKEGSQSHGNRSYIGHKIFNNAYERKQILMLIPKCVYVLILIHTGYNGSHPSLSASSIGGDEWVINHGLSRITRISRTFPRGPSWSSHGRTTIEFSFETANTKMVGPRNAQLISWKIWSRGRRHKYMGSFENVEESNLCCASDRRL